MTAPACADLSCAEIWGVFGSPAAMAGQLADPGDHRRAPLTDHAGRNWGVIAWQGARAAGAVGRWTLRSGDASVSWHGDGDLTLSRTARGMHTLYYRQDGERVHFASRLPRLLHGLPAEALRFEWRSLADVLALGRVLAPMTMFAGVFHLEPGGSLLWRASQAGPPVAQWTSHPDSHATDAHSDDADKAPCCPFGSPGEGHGHAVARALAVASPVEIFDQLAVAAGALGQPVGGMAEAAFSALLETGQIQTDSLWDVDADLRADAGPANDVLLMRSALRGRWRKQLLEYWAEERRPGLLDRAAPERAATHGQRIAAWRIASERRLHLTALAEPHGRRLRFATAGTVAPAPAVQAACDGVWATAPQVGNLLANAIDLHRNRAASGNFVWCDALRLSPFRVRALARSAVPGFVFRFHEAVAAILSMQYLGRFATVLPLPALPGTPSDKACA
jgi:hypothetical protein